jgi:hypothetical protein
VYGAGLICAGIFRADPVPGFPPGSTQAVISWHGSLHLLFAAIGFFALVAAMIVLGRRWSMQGDRGWALYSMASGILFLLCFLGAVIGGPVLISAGGSIGPTVLGLWIAVITGWLWLTLIESRLILDPSAVSTGARP